MKYIRKNINKKLRAYEIGTGMMYYQTPKKNKTMGYDFQCGSIFTNYASILDASKKEFILMYSMGFEDRKGREIYEGDIVKVYHDSKVVAIHEIELYDFEWIQEMCKKLEVMGDMCKNKELLNLPYNEA